MDEIDRIFVTKLVNIGKESGVLSEAISHSLQMAKDLLNKYYELTDCSDVYRIAMSTFLVMLMHVTD